MIFKRRSLGITHAFVALAFLSVLAQSRGVSQEAAAKRVDPVSVTFVVTDQQGRFITDLREDQFTILDGGKPAHDIVAFESQTELPVRLGLLFDASNSIRERFVFEKQAAAEFLRRTIRPSADQAFVLAFDEVSEITADFTSDLDKLAAGIQQIRPGGGTAVWDAVYYACRDKLMKHQETGAVRRVIVLVSDGDDNQSRVLRPEAIEMAQRAQVTIYAISTNLSNVPNSGDQNLQMLTDATGGRAFHAVKLPDISVEFNQIQSELRRQYLLSYRPEQLVANGEFRTVQIVVSNPRMKVRARKGYFAPNQ